MKNTIIKKERKKLQTFEMNLELLKKVNEFIKNNKYFDKRGLYTEAINQFIDNYKKN